MIQKSMKKVEICLVIFFVTFFLTKNVFAKINYFSQGEELFNKKKFSESKFKFEKDIVFNPKSEKSYLYLAKIFKKICKNLCEKEKELSKTLQGLQTK